MWQVVIPLMARTAALPTRQRSFMTARIVPLCRALHKGTFRPSHQTTKSISSPGETDSAFPLIKIMVQLDS